VLSAGQTRLRELVEASARAIDPAALWWPEERLHFGEPAEQAAGAMLKQLRADVLGDAVITSDAITGQQLHRPPVSPTYAQAQCHAGPAETFSMAPIDADVIVDCRTGSAGHELACAGADKPQTVYGALTWLAQGRPLPFPVDVDATLLRGSRMVICGGGGHHRTLACFLWGAGELVGEITIVDELADEELHAACRLIDSRLPHPTRGLRVKPHPQGHAARRAQLLELAERLQPLRPLSERDLSAPVPDVEILVFALDLMRPLRRLWLGRRAPGVLRARR
jgi:hypothetical protein